MSKVYIQGPNSGETQSFDFDPSLTIGELKTLIADTFKISIQDQILKYHNKILKDAQTLSFLRIKAGSKLQLLAKSTSPTNQPVPTESSKKSNTPSLSITFNLCIPMKGSMIPCISGSIPELNGLALSPRSNHYGWQLTVNLSKPPVPETDWYSYSYRTKLGATVHEIVPRRYFPTVCDGCSLFDTFDIPTPLSEVVLRFKVAYRTYFGQEVYIVGEGSSLGNWNSKNSIPLHPTGYDDIWCGDVRFPISSHSREIQYKYLIFDGRRKPIWEPGLENHSFLIGPTLGPTFIEVRDVYHWPNPISDAFTRLPFLNVFHKRAPISENSVERIKSKEVSISTDPTDVLISFTVKCPQASPSQRLLLIGSAEEVGQWVPIKAVPLDGSSFPVWKVNVSVKRSHLPFEYKYILVSLDQSEPVDKLAVFWEERENRICQLPTIQHPTALIIDDWYTTPSVPLFKAFGIKTAVSSLRTSRSTGIGQYTDLIKLADFAAKCGSSLIQILPIYDSSSNPFDIISAFALNPSYLDLLNINLNLIELTPQIKEQIYQLINNDNQPKLNYSEISQQKKQILHQIFLQIYPKYLQYLSTISDNSQVNEKPEQSEKSEEEKEFDELTLFATKNKEWLLPYALFKVCCDINGTNDYHKWPRPYCEFNQSYLDQMLSANKEGVDEIIWQQFICEKQLKSVKDYLSHNHIVLQGTIPVGLSIYSAESWAWPDLFKKDVFDENNSLVYDWNEMALNKFSWWENRLRRASELFDMIEIDHPESFFYQFEKYSDDITGNRGHFYPLPPIQQTILQQKGFYDINRLTQPFINYEIVKELFKDDTEKILDLLFDVQQLKADEINIVGFKPEIRSYLTSTKDAVEYLEKNNLKQYEKPLCELLDNILLIQDKQKPGNYYIRRNFQNTFSFKALQDYQQNIFRDLQYVYDYYSIMMEIAVPKLDMLSKATPLMISGPFPNIYEVSTYRTFIRTEKLDNTPDYFGFYQQSQNTFDSRYLSICERSQLRSWWKEDEERSQWYWRDMLWRNDQYPEFLPNWAQEMIVKKGLWSDSMWLLVSLQDLAGIDTKLRRQNPFDEKFELNGEWNYRCPWTLEELISNEQFIKHIYNIAADAKRCNSN